MSAEKSCIRILFVCTGNICRSPTAEGVFRQLVEDKGLSAKYEIDSAGTHGFHVGAPPDHRSCEVALQSGYDLRELKARAVNKHDFKHFDLILAMDHSHYEFLKSMETASSTAKVAFFTFYDEGDHIDVLDPYYGDRQGFVDVLHVVEKASEALLQQLETGTVFE